MTAILIVILALAIGGTIGVCWSYFGPPAAAAADVPAYPAGVTMELADRPLRQAWDSLTADEQATWLQLPPDQLLEELSLLAWMEGLALPVANDVPVLELASASPGDWGPSYG